MKEKILNTIKVLRNKYNNGGYTLTEYVELLNALNNTVWNIEKFLLCDEVNPSEIQKIIQVS